MPFLSKIWFFFKDVKLIFWNFHSILVPSIREDRSPILSISSTGVASCLYKKWCILIYSGQMSVIALNHGIKKDFLTVQHTTFKSTANQKWLLERLINQYKLFHIYWKILHEYIDSSQLVDNLKITLMKERLGFVFFKKQLLIGRSDININIIDR